MSISDISNGDHRVSPLVALQETIDEINEAGLVNDVDKHNEAHAAMGNKLSVATRNATGQPLTGTLNGLPFEYTYNTDGTVATLSWNGNLETYTYENGLLDEVV